MKLFAIFFLCLCVLRSSSQENPGSPEIPALINPGSWSMVLLPDPQGYTKFARNQPLLDLMTTWINDNTKRLNIKLVLCTGDLVEQNYISMPDSVNGDQTSRQQWEAISGAFKRLDQRLPYILCTGNHDYGTNYTENRYSQFNSYFPPERNPLNRRLLVEMAPNASGVRTLENACYAFTTPYGGKMLIFSLEFDPRKAVVEWARKLAARPEFRNYLCTVLTHSYMRSMVKQNERIDKEVYPLMLADATTGQSLWEQLIAPSGNIRMVYCGHTVDVASHQGHVGFREDRNAYGMTVQQMLFNAQNEGGNWKGNGGDGWLRILEFLPDQKTVQVRTFSPLFGASPATRRLAWRREVFDEFRFTIDDRVAGAPLSRELLSGELLSGELLSGKLLSGVLTPEQELTLSNYTFASDTKNAEVGEVISRKPVRGKARLLQDTSGLFLIDSRNILQLKKNKEVSGAAAFQYEVRIALNKDTGSFILVRDEFIHNRVVAHRGAWKHPDVSQNSLKSLQFAIGEGCEGSEFDVWLSDDSIPVISHDGIIGGKKIEQTSAAELHRIPLKNNDSVPLLAEYLSAIKQQNKTRLFLEIKTSDISQERTIELTRRVVGLVRSMKAQAWVYYISFNYEVLKKILELDPSAKTSALWGERPPAVVKQDKLWGLDYPYDHYKKNASWIPEAHRAGLTVNVWTVDQPEKLEEMVEAGADLITTNEPEKLHDIINQRQTAAPAVLRVQAMSGPSIQVDPSFPYYLNRSDASIADEILLAGYKTVHYFVVNENHINGSLIAAFHRRGIAVWLMTLGNGTYSTKDFPAGWEKWEMKLVRPPVNSDFTHLSQYSQEYTAWKKASLVRLLKEYAFDGVELAESYFPEWDALRTGHYGDIGENARVAFKKQYGLDIPDFIDSGSSHYYKKHPADYQKWVQFRVDGVNDFLNDIFNGKGGVREAKPGVLVATWSLGIDAGSHSVEKLREDQGLDAAAMIARVKPDLHIFQTHWPDWVKPESQLPPDYMKAYQPFVETVQHFRPRVRIGLQADQGSAQNMIKSTSWVKKFNEEAGAYGYDTWTTYEYHLGGYMYTERPVPKKAIREADGSFLISFSKRIDEVSAKQKDNYRFFRGGKLVNVRVREIRVDGNRVIIVPENKTTGEYEIGVSHVKDTPELWLYKGYKANEVEGGVRVKVGD